MTCREFAEVLPALLAGLFLKSMILCLAAAAGHLLLLRARPAVRSAWFQSCLLALLLLPLLHGLLPPLSLKVLPPERAGSSGKSDGITSLAAMTPADEALLLRHRWPDEWRPTSGTTASVERHPEAGAESRSLPSRLAPLFSQWPSAVTLVYATGLLLLFIRFAACIGAAGRWTRGLRPVRNPRVLSVLARLQQRMKVKGRIAVCVRAGPGSPTATGWLRPAIIVPPGLLNKRNEDLLEAALAHELAHISRGDLWWALLGKFVTAMYWPNPLVWWSAKRLTYLREFACDDLSAGLWQRPSLYADRLERIVLTTPVRGVPAVNARMTRRNSIVDRVARLAGMSRRTCTRPGHGRDALLLASALLLCAVLAAVTLAPRDAAAVTAASKGIPRGARDHRILRASPATLRTLLSDLRPGDILLLADGNYGDLPALAGIRGSENAPVVIRAEGDGALFDSPPRPVSLTDLRSLTLEGLRIGTPGERPPDIHIRGSRHLTVRGCRIRGGIRASECPDLVVENNEIYESASHGIYLAARCDNAVIRGNVIRDASAAGMFFSSEDRPGAFLSGLRVESNTVARCGSKGAAAFAVCGVLDSRFTNNLAYKNLANGFTFYRSGNAVRNSGHIVAGNTVYFAPDEGHNCILMRDGCRDFTVKNNIFFGGLGGALAVHDDSRDGLACDFNLISNHPDQLLIGEKYPHDPPEEGFTLAAEQWRFEIGFDRNSKIGIEPGFVSIENDDYRLRDDSPARDAGAGAAAIYLSDLDGNPRPSGAAFDMGCYEHKGTGGEAPKPTVEEPPKTLFRLEVVDDSSDAPIPLADAAVRVNANTKTALTDDNGRYSFERTADAREHVALSAVKS